MPAHEVYVRDYEERWNDYKANVSEFHEAAASKEFDRQVVLVVGEIPPENRVYTFRSFPRAPSRFA